ncbi:glycosyltransferase family 4 protein [bacterium]|nr:glycosyltransferase family 4 protein [bacterium]
MKILMISNLFPPYVLGGAEIFAYELTSSLAKKHEVLVVSTCDHDQKNQFAIEDFEDFKVLRFFPKNAYWLFNRKKRSILQKALWHLIDYFNFHSYFSLIKIIQEFQPDIIHTHNVDGFSASVWYAAKKCKTKLIHTAHDGHFVCPQALFFHKNKKVDCGKLLCKVFRKVHIPSAKQVDLFVSPSQFLLDTYAQLGLHPKSSQVIENGIPTVKVQKQKKIDPLKVLYVGQVSNHKGVQCLIECVKHFSNQDIEFHVAGKGPEEETLIQLQTQFSNLYYHGFVKGEDKTKLFEQVNILLFPSEAYENAPITLIEAFQYGLVIIAANIGGVPEMVVENESGFLFENNDYDKVFQIINQLSSNHALLKVHSEKSFQHFKKFQIEITAQNYEKAYQKLLDQ